MYIDAFTVLLFSLLVKVALGVLLLVFCIRDRRATWFPWWSAAFLLAAVAHGIFLGRSFGDDFSTISTAVASIIAACGCCWQGARAFERRAPLWLPVVAGPVLWFGACLVPGFLENTAYRVTLSSCLISALFAMTAVEFRRGGDERLPSRGMIVVLFASVALIFAARIPLIPLAPFPFGALPAEPDWVTAFNLILFFHAIAFAVLLVALTRERHELEQRSKALRGGAFMTGSRDAR